MRINSMPALTGAIVLLASCLTANADAGSAVYRVTNLGNPGGGSLSQGTGDNRPGIIAGFTLLPDSTMHAELWSGGKAMSLGTLGGPNSSVAWPNRNHHGVVAGIAETAEVQPRGEQWSCFAAIFFLADNHVCEGFVWRNGSMAALPTLGGAFWNTPMDVNDRGDVAGFSDLPGDGPTLAQANFHAFFWSVRPYTCNGTVVTGTCDLGTLSGDNVSEALGVNDRDQVVGISLPSRHAFIWQNGRMTDLNSMLAPGTMLVLTDAQDINDRGEITGQAADPSTSTTVAFDAIPLY